MKVIQYSRKDKIEDISKIYSVPMCNIVLG